MLKIIQKTEDLLDVEFNGERITTTERAFGNCREVFLAENVVIKFDGSDSYEQNKSEVFFYEKRLLEMERGYFANILEHGEVDGLSYIVQERVYDTGEDVTEEHQTTLRNLKENYGLADMYLSHRSEFHHNVLIAKGGIKIYDVGVGDHNPNWGF